MDRCWRIIVGSEERPDYANDLRALDGGVMGEGGCPSRAEVKRYGFRRKTFSRVRTIEKSLQKVKKIL
jgi:hypothetical protein